MAGQRIGPLGKYRSQIVSSSREQAGVKLSVGGNARPMAVPTERFADGTDETHLAHTIGETVSGGDFATVLRIQRSQRPLRVDAVAQLGRRHHALAPPAVAGAYVHVFDETDDVAMRARERHQRQHFTLVDVALHDTVELYGREAGRRCGVDALEDVRDFTAATRQVV